MKRYLVFMAALMLCAAPLWSQKTKTVEFTAEGLPDELAAYFEKQTTASDKQREGARAVKAMRAYYESQSEQVQKRLADIYTYTVRAKLKAYPDLLNLTTTLNAYASTNNANMGAWIEVLNAYRSRAAKAKAINDWVDFSATLLANRTLYSSNISQWSFPAATPFRIAIEDGVPLVYFDTPSNLRYASAKDAYVINATTGYYDFRNNLWYGHGGRVDWSRTGMLSEACWADLSDYKAETKFPKFTADSVLFTNTHYFSTPILGKLEEALGSVQEPEKYSYPRFRSYQRDFELKDILPGVDYSGSFMMNGSRFITADSKHPASVIFRHEGKARLRVSSLGFTITPDRLVAQGAEATFYLGDEDSLTNTGLLVRYMPAQHKVMIINDAKRNYYSPFVDSYHELDIYCEQIEWNQSTERLEFSNLGTSGAVSMVEFESSNYYTYRKYRAIHGIDEINPAQRVYDYYNMRGNNFSVKNFAQYIGMDRSQALLMIHNLSRHGLVTYNEMTGRVLVKEKLDDYVNAANRVKGLDYDAISFESQTRGVNAELSLADNDLLMHGVRQFVVSDSQQVMVYPRGGNIKVGKNRSVSFDGRIDCGKFIMFVTGGDFSYEQFAFELPKVDTLFFYVPEFDKPDTSHLVQTPLYNLVGTLTVDKPNNHCGLTKNKEYPIFDSRENSYVFFDKASIQRGRYVRERFYYTLHPFTINSLVKFKTDDLAFNGVLNSGGIFPDIVEPLRVQRDYYLGFRVETPAGGYPAYGGKGQYTNEVRLDHNGLRGTGQLDYLTSSSTSRDYLFLLDSMFTTTDTFYVREEQGFPDILNSRVAQRWYPYADSMSCVSLKQGKPFRMYHNEATLRGAVALVPAGASASGEAQVHEATLSSTHFALASREMGAEVTDFALRSNKLNAVVFSASNLRSNINFDEQQGTLQSREGLALTNLQAVKYQAYADQFDWDMTRHTLALVNTTRPNSEGMSQMDLRMRMQKRDDLPGVRFVSTDPARHSLAFNALRGNYMYEEGNLASDGVYLLQVADAAIAPDADTLYVTKGGNITPLQNAQLVCDREHAYHYITQANLDIESAKSYTGKGYINYVDDVEKKQTIFLDKIHVVSGITHAEGTIGADAQFTLSSAFGFAGKVRAEGNQPLLWFEGGVRLVQPCIPAQQLGLLAYADYTDPEHIHVVVPEQPTDWQGNRISAAIMLDNKTLQPRQSFLTNEKPVADELLSAHGVLTYLGDRHQYMIASEQKVSDPDAVVAPYLALNTDNCEVSGEGLVNLAQKRTQATFYGYGTAHVGVADASNDNLTTLFGASFPISADVVATMAQNIKDDLRLSMRPSSSNPEMRHALMYHMGADQGAGAYALYSSTGKLANMPDAMQSTFLFDNIKWQFSASMGLFFDGKVGLVAVGDQQLGLEVRLKAQIYKRNNSQQMVFYIQIANDHWYFFRYDLGSQELTLYSSNGIWLDQIKAIPLDGRKISKEGLGTFRYFVGNNPSEVQAWLTWFTKTAYPDDLDY